MILPSNTDLDAVEAERDAKTKTSAQGEPSTSVAEETGTPGPVPDMRSAVPWPLHKMPKASAARDAETTETEVALTGLVVGLVLGFVLGTAGYALIAWALHHGR